MESVILPNGEKSRELWREGGVLTPLPGAHVSRVILDLCALAQEGKPATAEFNGVTITAQSDSDPNMLYQKWEAELTAQAEAYRASDEYKRREAEAAAAEARRVQDAAIALAGAPEEPTWSDPDSWAAIVEKNTDPYGAAALNFARRWARMMEKAADREELTKDAADTLANLANDEGITGFQFGCARNALVLCWEHGAALQKAYAGRP